MAGHILADRDPQRPIPATISLRDVVRLAVITTLFGLWLLNHAGFMWLFRVDVCVAVPEARSAIALTFDDGPSPEYTPAVLDILAEHDAKATFFVVGEAAEAHPEIVERIIAEGHEIGHHTYTHPQVDILAPDSLVAEMDKAYAALEGFGVTPHWYRPPRKELTFAQKRMASERGMSVALWTRALERKQFRDSGEMATTLVEETQAGDILLAHDGRLDRSMTVDALPELLEGLEARGFEFLTLSELHAHSE